MLLRNLDALLNSHWWAQKAKWKKLQIFRRDDKKKKKTKQTNKNNVSKPLDIHII